MFQQPIIKPALSPRAQEIYDAGKPARDATEAAAVAARPYLKHSDFRRTLDAMDRSFAVAQAGREGRSA